MTKNCFVTLFTCSEFDGYFKYSYKGFMLLCKIYTILILYNTNNYKFILLSQPYLSAFL